nr:T9SS type A sorting domain-containing protein [Nitrosopumilus sp.]
QQNNSWNQLPDLPGLKRGGAVGFSINGKGYIGSGFDTAGTGLDDFWVYDSINQQWQSIADLPMGPVVYAVGFSIGDYGYVGMGAIPFPPPLTTLWEYSPVTGISDLNANDYNITIFPNPFQNTLTIKTDLKMNGFCNYLKIFDMKGKLIFERDLKSIFNNFNFSNLKNGNYLFQILDCQMKTINSSQIVIKN